MRKFIFSSIICLGVISFSNAQIGEPLSVGTNAYEVHGLKEDFDQSILGSPYTNKIYLNSEVSGYGELQLKFNAYTGDMEFEENGERMALKSEEYPEVFFGPQRHKYLHVNYKDGRQSQSGYMKVLSENKNATIFIKEVITFTPAQKSSSGYSESKQAAYKVGKNKIYISTGGEVVELPTNAKKFSQLFKDKEAVVADFLKNSKLSLSKESDLVKINEFLGSL